MKEMIQEQLNHIQKLDERVLLKELLNGVFMGLYEKNEEMYNALEQRVFDEIEYDKHSYSIQTSIIEKKDYDRTHHLLAPILEEDIEEKVYDLEAILNAMNENQPYFMLKVFLKVDYLVFRDIINADEKFRGIIHTDKRNYEAYFKIEMNKDYQNKIHQLYKIFIKNGIPWRTINAPYISKMVNVYLINCTESINLEEEIVEIDIDFGQYAKYVQYDLVPVWNVKRLELTSTGFPMPCEDHINYEHLISIKEYGVDNGYLVEDSEEQIQYVRHNKENLTVVGKIPEAQQWYVYMIIREKATKLDQYKYPLMTNSQKRSFTEHLNKQTGMVIKTKAELVRLIESYKFNTYFQFKEFKIENIQDSQSAETYNLNEFIIDEIRDSNYTKKLILYFTSTDSHLFIIRDLLSFIISEIQLFYPEYQCEGKLI